MYVSENQCVILEKSVLKNVEKMSPEIIFKIYEYLMPHVKIDIFKYKYTNLQILFWTFIALTEGDKLQEKREMMMGLYHRYFGKKNTEYDCRFNGFTDCDNNYFHYYPRQRVKVRGYPVLTWYEEDMTDYEELIEELWNSIHKKEKIFRKRMEHLLDFPCSTILRVTEEDWSNIYKIYKLYCDIIYSNKMLEKQNNTDDIA